MDSMGPWNHGVSTSLQNYNKYREGLEKLIHDDPESAILSLRVLDFCMWFNLEMQFASTAAIQIPEPIRDKVARFGNHIYPKEVLEWPF